MLPEATVASCDRGRHLGPGTCRSTTAQRADIQPELHQTPLTRTL